MSITRSYFCNICRDVYTDRLDKLHGIHFDVGNKFEVKPPRGVENHVCQGCIDQLVEFEKSKLLKTIAQ